MQIKQDINGKYYIAYWHGRKFQCWRAPNGTKEECEEQSRKFSKYETTHCSNCGGEFDSEGWCPNYCMEGE